MATIGIAAAAAMLADVGTTHLSHAVEGHPEKSVVAQRFVTTENGGRLLTIRRQVGVVVLAAGAGAGGRLHEVRTGATAARWMRRRNKAVLGAH